MPTFIRRTFDKELFSHNIKHYHTGQIKNGCFVSNVFPFKVKNPITSIYIFFKLAKMLNSKRKVPYQMTESNISVFFSKSQQLMNKHGYNFT